MSNVNGPQQPTGKPVVTGPLKGGPIQVKANPVKQMQTTERVFDKAFDSAPATQLGDDQSGAPVQISPVEQTRLFSGLLPLMGQPSKATPSEAFEFPSLTEPAQPFSSGDLQNAFFSPRGKGARLPAQLGKLSDAMAQGTLNVLNSRLTQLSLVSAKMKLSPAVIAQVQSQLIVPLKAQLKKQLAGLGNATDDDTAANSTLGQASGHDGTASGGTAGNPAFGTIITPAGATAVSNAVGSIQSNPAMAGMDIDALVEMVIMECGQQGELDLRDIASQLQKNIDSSNALRDLKQKQDKDATAVKAQVDQEYANFVQEFHDDPTTGINPANCSQAQYEQWRPVVLTNPIIDQSTDPPTITYTPPSLAVINGIPPSPPPSILPDSCLPASFNPNKTATANQGLGIPDSVMTQLQALWQVNGQPDGDFNSFLTDPAPVGLALTSPITSVADAQSNLTKISTWAGSATPPPPNASDAQKYGLPGPVYDALQAAYKDQVAAKKVDPSVSSFDDFLQKTCGCKAPPVTSEADATANLTAVQNVGGLLAAWQAGDGIKSDDASSLTDALKNNKSIDMVKTPPVTAAGTTLAALSAGYANGPQSGLNLPPPQTTVGNNVQPVFQDAQGNTITDTCGNQLVNSETGADQWSTGTQGLLDDQTSMGQELQLKLQMAQTAYTQCMQAVSNIMKTDSDTKDAIIKNLNT